MSKKELIPEIFVYCDRWCERCPFTNRCEIFDAVDQRKDQSAVDANEFMNEVAATFEKTMSLLKKEADACGINWNQLVADAKSIKLETPILPVEHEEVVALAKNYRLSVTDWLAESSNAIAVTTSTHLQHIEIGVEEAGKNNARFVEALEVINWYYPLIEAKVRRAISGFHNTFDQEDARLNYGNGCAKISILFIDKSIWAWEQIASEMPNQADEILDHLAVLSKLKDKFQKIFPAHKAFIRPGFDTFIA